MKRQLQYVICDSIKKKYKKMNYELLNKQSLDWEKAHKAFEMKVKYNQMYKIQPNYEPNIIS